MNRPTVDVIIPAYNSARYIGHTLDSVLAQTCPVHEIIVVDDGSKDQTAGVLKELQNTIPNLVFISKPNGGPNSARNMGVRASTADCIAFLDADDVWISNKLARQIDILEQSPDTGLVYCAYDLIDDNNSPINEGTVEPRLRENVYQPLLEANLISGSCSGVLVKKTCLDKVGAFDESLRYAEDWDMWLRLAKITRFDFAEEPLVHIRRHTASAQANFTTASNVCATIQMLAKHLGSEPVLVTKYMRRQVVALSYFQAVNCLKVYKVSLNWREWAFEKYVLRVLRHWHDFMEAHQKNYWQLFLYQFERLFFYGMKIGVKITRFLLIHLIGKDRFQKLRPGSSLFKD